MDGVAELGEQALRRHRRRDPLEARCERRRRRGRREPARTSQTSTPPAARPEARPHGSASPCSCEPPGQLALAVGEGQCVELDSVASVARRRSSRAPNWPAVMSSWASRVSASSRASQQRPRSSTVRLAAAAGLLISWARPAASVPEGDQGVALAHRRLDRPRRAVQAAHQVSGEREPVVDQLAKSRRVEPQHPARGRAAAGREVDAVVVPRPEATRPAARQVHPRHDDVLAPDLADQVERARRAAPTTRRRARPR